MMPADKLLPLLNKVHLLKPSQWVACCPAHDDRNPSLKITEAGDGTLLLKCWAGCPAAQIVAAIGLDMRDLFPDGGQRSSRQGPSRAAVEHERYIVAIGLSLQARGEKLPKSDLDRLEMARRRLAQREERV